MKPTLENEFAMIKMRASFRKMTTEEQETAYMEVVGMLFSAHHLVVAQQEQIKVMAKDMMDRGMSIPFAPLDPAHFNQEAQ